MIQLARSWVLLLGTFAAFLPGSVRAAPDEGAKTVAGKLRWEAPVGCPDEATVSSEIERLLATSEHDARSVDVDGMISITGEGYALRLVITVDEQSESRTIASENCQLLSTAAALLVAITVDAVAAAATITEKTTAQKTSADGTTDVAGSRTASVPNPTVVPPALVEAPEPPPLIPAPEQGGAPAPAPAPPTKRDRPMLRWRHGIEGGIGGGLAIALVPGITGGLEGDIGWRYGPIRLRALGYHWFGRTRTVDADTGVFAALSGAGLRGCYAVQAGPVELPLCVGPELGALHGRGTGTGVEPHSPADLWVALAVGVGAELPLSARFALRARIELVTTVRRPALHLDGPNGRVEAFRAPPLGFRVVLGASVRSK